MKYFRKVIARMKREKRKNFYVIETPHNLRQSQLLKVADDCAFEPRVNLNGKVQITYWDQDSAIQNIALMGFNTGATERILFNEFYDKTLNPDQS